MTEETLALRASRSKFSFFLLTIILVFLAITFAARAQFDHLEGVEGFDYKFTLDAANPDMEFDIADPSNRLLCIEESTDGVNWFPMGDFKITNTYGVVAHTPNFAGHPKVLYRIRYNSADQVTNNSNTILDLPETPFEYANIPLPNHLTQNNENNSNNTPATNPITNPGATLGRVLFYDRRLSISNTISCADCHHQDKGFTDGVQFSVGFDGGLTGRNSMGLAMARFYRGPVDGAFFWDERAPTLEDQTTGPVQDAVEMGSSFPALNTELGLEPYYQELFAAAFPADPTINETNIQLAIAQFVRSMVSFNSRYDQEQQAPGTVFTAQEQLGEDIFRNQVPGNVNDPTHIVCSSCHTTDNFVGNNIRNIGLDLDPTAPGVDNGVGAVTGNPGQNGLFKIGSLRNVEVTGPYMHDGRFDTLEEVIDHYSTGIQAHPNLSNRLQTDGTLNPMGAMGPPVQPNYTQAEKDALVAFLKTLTDPTFLNDPRWGDPFNYTGIPGAPTPNFTATFLTVPALPAEVDVTSITVGGIAAQILDYDEVGGVVELLFDASSLAPGNYNAVLTHGGGTTVWSVNQFNVPGGGTPLFTTSFPTSPPLPLLSEVDSITVGGVVALIVSYDQSTGAVGLDFDDSGLAPGSYDAILTYGGGTMVNSLDAFVVNPPPAGGDNILFLIVDDWAIDMSPVDNTIPPATVLPNMPNLQTFAAGGLRFTRGYVTPVCSPTRAAIISGRFASQTGVYQPGNGGNVLPDSELALPEAFTAAGSNYSMGAMGKWHLGNGAGGNNNQGPMVTGGWDEFYGITGGGVGDYLNWPKNINGVVTNNHPVYTTTDQVNEAVAFIGREETAGNPWLCWVAFNAPHTPHHNPPAGLAPPGGYSAQAPGESTDSHQYRMMCEALDTEIGRLLASVPADTNIILVGDNGTTGSVAQAPYGSGHAKGSIYNGGTNVTWIVSGPAVTAAPGSTSDELVKAVDLYTTMLELAGIDPASVPGMPATTLANSKSIVPILDGGTDAVVRDMITEGGNAGPGRGRAIIAEAFPDYKLIIKNDPELVPTVAGTQEFYHTGVPGAWIDQNELSPLNIATLTGTALDAYNACVAIDAAQEVSYINP